MWFESSAVKSVSFVKNLLQSRRYVIFFQWVVFTGARCNMGQFRNLINTLLISTPKSLENKLSLFELFCSLTNCERKR